MRNLRVTSFVGLCLALFTGCTHTQISEGVRLSRADYLVETDLKDYPGESPGRVVGRNYSWAGFLNQKVGASRTGIYFTESYQVDKTPVLFIHGLVSDPYTWSKITTELRQDPEIVENFQLWYYAYPTSMPIIGSAAIFRDHLDSLVAKLEEENGVDLSREIILVGHSMGGILAKSAVSHSGDILWESAFTVPAEKLVMPASSQQFLDRAFRFSPRTYIKGAVFVATPHRGSSVAEGFAGNIGVKIAGRSQLFESALSALVSPSNREKLTPSFLEFLEQPLTSVSTLRRDAPIAKLLADLPIDEDVSFHSVAGRRKDTENSDGIVSISSTELEGTVSEFLLESDHSAHKHQAAAELLSLYLKHDAGILTEAEAREKAEQIQGVIEAE